MFGPGASQWRAWFSWPCTGSWALSSSWEHLMALDLQTLGVAVTSSAKALPPQCFLWVTLVSFPSLPGKWNMLAVGWWEDVGTRHNETMENPELAARMQVCHPVPASDTPFCLSLPCGMWQGSALAAVFYDSLWKVWGPTWFCSISSCSSVQNIFKIIAWFVFYSGVGHLPLTSGPFS